MLLRFRAFAREYDPESSFPRTIYIYIAWTSCSPSYTLYIYIYKLYIYSYITYIIVRERPLRGAAVARAYPLQTGSLGRAGSLIIWRRFYSWKPEKTIVLERQRVWPSVFSTLLPQIPIVGSIIGWRNTFVCCTLKVSKPVLQRLTNNRHV